MKKIIGILSIVTIFVVLFGIIPTSSFATNAQKIEYNLLDINYDNSVEWKSTCNSTCNEVKTGQINKFQTQNSNQIRLQVNQSAQINITEYEDNPKGELPNQTRAMNCYMYIEMNQTVKINATLLRNYTWAEVGELNGITSTFRWAFYNESTHQWQYAEHNWIEENDEGMTVYCNTTHFSLWTILAYEVDDQNGTNEGENNTTPDTQWNKPENKSKQQLTPGKIYRIETQTRNQIKLQVNDSVDINITEYEKNPEGELPNQTKAMNCYMNIEMNQSIKINATLFYNFTQEDLEGIQNRSCLRWAFFNTSTNRWQYAEQNWIENNSDGITVYCNTTHFSTWVILSEETDSSADSGDTGSSEDQGQQPMVPEPGSPCPVDNGTRVAFRAGYRYIIQTKSGFTIEVKFQQNAEFNLTEYESPPKVMNKYQHQVRTQTMSIEVNVTSGIQANLSFTFTNQIRSQFQVQNINQLRFMFYNENTGEWEAAENQWLDGETLYCNTTHFSLWTIAEEVVDDQEGTNDSTPGFSFVLLLALLPIYLQRKKQK